MALKIRVPWRANGFDGAHIVRPVRVSDARGGRGATVAYDPRAHADSEKRLQEFLARHLKRGSGAPRARRS